MTYANDVQTVSTPVNQPVRGMTQIVNRTGGYGFEITDEQRLERFLILGHQGGTYYATQRELSYETADCLDRLNPLVAIEIICNVSDKGRAPKNDPAIFALAYLIAKRHPSITGSVMSHAIRKVCRTGTHLFDFLTNCKAMGRGWGPAFRSAVSDWYTQRSPLALAKQITKYAQRNGWAHRDVLRLCHAKPNDFVQNMLFAFATQHDGWGGCLPDDAAWNDYNVHAYLHAVTAVQDPALRTSDIIQMIQQVGLEREHLPTQRLNEPAIWEALLPNMGLMAMIRNLNKMTSIGMVRPLSAASNLICEKLNDADEIKSQRLHPISILIAQRMYKQGYGTLGSLRWTPDQNVVAALESAFYKAFDAVTPTGKRIMCGVDVSGSMGQHRCTGTNLITAREAACLMAMLAVRTEPRTFIHAFSNRFMQLPLSKTSTLEEAVTYTRTLPFERTNCGVPMQYALDNNLEVDCFCIYTDNETNDGNKQAFQLLREYRRRTGIPAKLAVFGFANTNFSIADPNDAGMMDFVGFDASAPVLLNNFIES